MPPSKLRGILDAFPHFKDAHVNGVIARSSFRALMRMLVSSQRRVQAVMEDHSVRQQLPQFSALVLAACPPPPPLEVAAEKRRAAAAAEALRYEQLLQARARHTRRALHAARTRSA